jgi:heme-degrading monooxygenase HmoA
MHATIHRHEGITGSSEEMMRFGRQQAIALSTLPGFISYALLEVGAGVLISVSVFETQAALEAAERLAEFRVGKQPPAPLSRPPHVTSGEVIVQRGM